MPARASSTCRSESSRLDGSSECPGALRRLGAAAWRASYVGPRRAATRGRGQKALDPLPTLSIARGRNVQAILADRPLPSPPSAPRRDSRGSCSSPRRRRDFGSPASCSGWSLLAARPVPPQTHRDPSRHQTLVSTPMPRAARFLQGNRTQSSLRLPRHLRTATTRPRTSFTSTGSSTSGIGGAAVTASCPCALAGRQHDHSASRPQPVLRTTHVHTQLKEVALAVEIERTYSKDNPRYDFNQISLAKAYGVEAGAKTYFNNRSAT